ncbi:hypothetical protein F5877DRAFT_73467, partial [Lentinula edodes]
RPPKTLPTLSIRLHVDQGILSRNPSTVPPSNTSETLFPPLVTKAPVVPPRALRRNREIEGLKADASTFHSNNELLSGFPSVGSAPRASLSTKVPMGRKEPKSKTTIKVVEDSKASNSPPAVKSEDEDEDENEEEDAAPPPKCLKTASSISASLPRRSVQRVTVPKRVTKAAVKPVPERSPDSAFQPVLLVDVQGRLRLPEQSTSAFTPFPKFAHARNSAALNCENPLLAINPEFLELGSILETQNARFTMQDLMKINQPSLPSQACVSALARGDLGANSAPLPGYKCQASSSQSLKCLGSLDVELAMDALNALHTASMSNFDNRTPGEWIKLLRSIHSGESTARVDEDGHLIESSPPPDSAAEVFEGLNEVEKGSADEGASSQVGGSIPMELDLPSIESLAEPTLSPEQGAEQSANS